MLAPTPATSPTCPQRRDWPGWTRMPGKRPRSVALQREDIDALWRSTGCVCMIKQFKQNQGRELKIWGPPEKHAAAECSVRVALANLAYASLTPAARVEAARIAADRWVLTVACMKMLAKTSIQACGTLPAIDSRTCETCQAEPPWNSQWDALNWASESHWISQWGVSIWASWDHTCQSSEDSWRSNLAPWMQDENRAEKKEQEMLAARLLIMRDIAEKCSVEHPPDWLRLPQDYFFAHLVASAEARQRTAAPVRTILNLDNKVYSLPECRQTPGTTHEELKCEPRPRATSAPPLLKVATHDQESAALELQSPPVYLGYGGISGCPQIGMPPQVQLGLEPENSWASWTEDVDFPYLVPFDKLGPDIEARHRENCK